MQLTAILSAISIVSVLFLSAVSCHGYVSSPAIRPISLAFRAKLPPLMQGLSDHELQRYPFEFLTQRLGPSAGYTYPGVYVLPCRGIQYQSDMPVNRFKPGQSVNVAWTIDARHPGFCDIFLHRNGQTSLLAAVDPCGESEGVASINVSLPNDLTGCQNGGNCYLEWYWRTRSNEESYSNCIDFTA